MLAAGCVQGVQRRPSLQSLLDFRTLAVRCPAVLPMNPTDFLALVIALPSSRSRRWDVMATRAVCRTLGSDERPRETQRPRLIIGYVLLAACALAAHSARCLVVIGQPGLATTCAGQSTQFQRHFACSLSS
eukprot:2968832-Amphidinium_carterae.1